MAFDERDELVRWQIELKCQLNELYKKKEQFPDIGSQHMLDHDIAVAQYRLCLVEERLHMVDTIYKKPRSDEFHTEYLGKPYENLKEE